MEQQQPLAAPFVLIAWGNMIQPHMNALAEAACAAPTRGRDRTHHASRYLFGVSVMVPSVDFCGGATSRENTACFFLRRSVGSPGLGALVSNPGIGCPTKEAEASLGGWHEDVLLCWCHRSLGGPPLGWRRRDRLLSGVCLEDAPPNSKKMSAFCFGTAVSASKTQTG